MGLSPGSGLKSVRIINPCMVRIIRMSWKFPLVYGKGLLWISYRTDPVTTKESLKPKNVSFNQKM
jgi:hypothetical protein